MERIIKRIGVEASHNRYILNNTYIEFIEKTKLLGGISYYANLVIRGVKCLIFYFEPNKNNVNEYLREVITYSRDLFAILDSKFTNLSTLSIDDKKRFNRWFYSDTFEKMYYWFDRGWLMKYSENEFGFSISSNYGQFSLNLDRKDCVFEIKDNLPEHENDCIMHLKNEEGIFFLIAVKLLVISKLLYIFERKVSMSRVPESRLGCLSSFFPEHFLERRVTFGHSGTLASIGIDILL